MVISVFEGCAWKEMLWVLPVAVATARMLLSRVRAMTAPCGALTLMLVVTGVICVGWLTDMAVGTCVKSVRKASQWAVNIL